MRWFCRVLAASIREEQGVSGSAGVDLRSWGQFLRELDPKAVSLHTGRNFLQEIPNLGFFALPCKDRALKNNMVRRTHSLLAKGTRCVAVKGSGSAVVHP
eukprot:5122501-Amphidinium_carterae.1